MLAGGYVMWAQFVSWHDPALTGAIRVQERRAQEVGVGRPSASSASMVVAGPRMCT